jgi:hypothetical protein
MYGIPTYIQLVETQNDTRLTQKTVEEIHDYVHHLKLRQEQRGKLQKAGFDPEAFGQLQHSLRQVEAWGFLMEILDSF